jgi:hypothetical protein
VVLILPVYWPDDIYRYYDPVGVPKLYCFSYYDPSGFHSRSAEFVGLLEDMMLNGGVIAGSAEAQQIEAIFEDVLGTGILNGVLTNGGGR